MHSSTRIFKIAATYTALILGAGFASGQELAHFFVPFGAYGVLSLVMAGIIFGLVGWAVMEICYTYNIKSYEAFLTRMIGAKPARFVNVIVVVFLFVLFATMLSAGGAVVEEMFFLPPTIGILLLAAVCFFVFLYDLNGIVKINSFCAPILVVGCIFVGLFAYFNQSVSVAFLDIPISHLIQNNWLLSAVTYASYNIVTGIALLASMHHLVNTKKVAKRSGILGGAVITLLGLSLALPLFANYLFISGAQIPLLKIAQQFHFSIQYCFLLLFLIAVFTTAIANGFGVIQALTPKLPAKPLYIKLFVVILAAIVAHIGFTNFVTKVYPLFGLLGFIEIVIILYQFQLARRNKS